MSAGPAISVVVTAHDAADSIADCLRSIAAQTSPASGAPEIILVDDRSTDGTGEAARAAKIDGLRLLRIDEYPNATLTARQEALDRGFREARGETVFVTDADAIVSPSWVGRGLAALESGGADAVAAPVEFRGRPGWLAALQGVDSIYYIGVCRILNRLGLASGVLFGDCAFRRPVYESLGGFRSIGRALTEDLSFARALHRKGLKLVFLAGPSVSVGACRTLGEVVRRGERVGSGGVSALAAVLGAWMIALVALGVLAVVGGGVFAQLLGLRYLAGVAFTSFALARARRLRHLPYALIYEPAAVIIGLCVLGRRGLRRPVEWGGVRYDRR